MLDLMSRDRVVLQQQLAAASCRPLPAALVGYFPLACLALTQTFSSRWNNDVPPQNIYFYHTGKMEEGVKKISSSRLQ